MSVEPVPVGARLFDSVEFSQGGTAKQAEAIRDAGADGVFGYLGSFTPARLHAVFSAGLGFMPVTYGGEYEDGAEDEVRQLEALGVEKGVTVYVDMEGLKAFHSDPKTMITKLETWAVGISAAGYQPGIYVGVPQPLTSDELYHLKGIVRYWRGMGSTRDRNNGLVEPACGWGIWQAAPSVRRGGVLVDANMVTGDYKGRLPAWMVA